MQQAFWLVRKWLQVFFQKKLLKILLMYYLIQKKEILKMFQLVINSIFFFLNKNFKFSCFKYIRIKLKKNS